ncbi:aspartate aminotransferase family protein [Falsirhodobacter deserti]|uniref:aspartate aminotransferase family protein n=1 Tax=Falsirhodobacter deserti TaxID=1365611 RepID=UPI000FE34886|nr:aspartate aminotransferase family protein [Falsirhodobacter deserti]
MQLENPNSLPRHAPNSTEARDIEYLLHPVTNAKAHRTTGPIIMERGEGVRITDTSGKTYIEAMAGLWSVGVGFSEKRLADAAYAQMLKLPYSQIFSHRSHGPAVDLAEKLVTMAPGNMSKAFFTSSGSEANDTALKFLWYRSNALGQPQKKKIISRNRAYHGITIAATSLTGIAANHNSFDLIVPDMIRLTCPHHYREAQEGESEDAFATRLAEELEGEILKAGPETVCAMIAEPVMGAGGVVVPPETYWPKIQEVLRKYDILLVADEVITGFGRTGQMFACDTYGITPDIIVLSKQISSSYLPISAILMNDRVLDPIIEQSDRVGVLAHGYTAAAHPVCAAVALENIVIIEERDLVANAAEVGSYMIEGLRALADHPLVGEVRGIGMIAALELVTNKAARTALEKPGQLGAKVQAKLMEHGVISRAVVDAQCFCPPMIMTRADVDDMMVRVRRALDDVAADVLA